MEIKSKRLLFTLILIGLVNAAAGCGGDKEPSRRGAGGTSGLSATGGVEADKGGAGDGGGVSASSGAGGVSVGAGGVALQGGAGSGAGTVGATGGAGGVGGTMRATSVCPQGEMEWTRAVKTPAAGVSPTVSAVCTPQVNRVESYRAGRVTLDLQGVGLNSALGRIEVAPGLAPLSAALPRIVVEAAKPSEIGNATVTDIVKTSSGFSFKISWPISLSSYHTGWDPPSLTIRVYLEVLCDQDADSGTRTVVVESITYFNLCAGPDHPIWVASGDQCTSCDSVCEMAAIPIVPTVGPDELALPSALSAEIVPIVEVSRSLTLFIDHRGARGPVRYAWKITAGTLSSNDQSETVWELPSDPGPHLVQVAVYDGDSAVVAALRWTRTA
jgi:hypothetical protein